SLVGSRTPGGDLDRTLSHFGPSLDAVAPNAERPPRERLGRYRLLEKLGEGGLGAVYRAEDLADGAVVAVKLLHPHRSGRPGALRRFRKEARLLAEVNNPYVANLV